MHAHVYSLIAIAGGWRSSWRSREAVAEDSSPRGFRGGLSYGAHRVEDVELDYRLNCTRKVLLALEGSTYLEQT